MNSVIQLYKPIGITPLQCIHAFVRKNPSYAGVKLGVAGRLDPMSEGLLLVLVGEENKKRKQYEALPKAYYFDVLFGIATDSYDVLGRVLGSTSPPFPSLSEKIKLLLPEYIGEQTQAYPPYSSMHVQGKPLFYWARRGMMETITVPTKKILIQELSSVTSYHIAGEEMEKLVQKRIRILHGSFRQDVILHDWHTFGLQHTHIVYPIFRFFIRCSSGTYVRSLANTFGKQLGTHALAFRIIRTQIGAYTTRERFNYTKIA